MLTSYPASQHLPTGASTSTHQGFLALTVLAPPPGGYRQFLLLLLSPYSHSVSYPFTLNTFIHSLIKKPFHRPHLDYLLPLSHSAKSHSARSHSVKFRLVELGVSSRFFICMCECLSDVSLLILGCASGRNPVHS